MNRTFLRLAVLAAAALAPGCLGRTPPSSFYALTPVAGEAPSPGGPAVRIAVVELPQYLRVNQVVTRSGPNELDLAELDRWGGSLDDELGRVLAANLERQVPSDRVASHAWGRGGTFDVSLYLGVRRFEAEGGVVHLEAHWALVGADGETRTARVSRLEASVPGGVGAGYPEVVGAMSTALAQLSDEIAAEIRAATGG